MMKRKESALRLGFTFAGCYLGAGYVSGQELWQFFGCFGWQGIAGLLLAVALSFFFGVLLLRLVQRTGCDQTDALVIRRPIPLLRDAVGLLQLFFLFGILVIMAAGVGALFAQILGASAFWCSAAFCLLISLLSLTGTSGMVNVFSTVVPLLVICSVLVSALTLRRCGWQLTIAAVPSVSPLLSHWAIAACSFVSYNLFSSIGILAPVGKELRSRRTVWWGVLLGCIILISIALGIFLTMEMLPTVVEAPLPMLAAAGALGGGWYYLYGVLLLCAMLGTALSCAVALRHYCMVRFSTMANRRFSFVLLLAIPAWLCSLFGFGKLIGTVYPICGALGALALLGLLHHRFTLRAPK